MVFALVGLTVRTSDAQAAFDPTCATVTPIIG